MLRLATIATLAVVLAVAGVHVRGDAMASGLTERTLSAFTLDGLEGAPLPLAQFAGQVVMVVNTASHCGFTNQYGGLQELYARYRDRGLVVLAVPSNDFGGQEPGTAEEIREICTGTYGVTFPIAAKADVTGDDALPLYRWLAGTLGARNVPRWNFHKYLIGRDGRPVAAFASQVDPMSPRVLAEIERLLAGQGPTG